MGKHIFVTCKNCGKQFKSNTSSIGKNERCPGCGSVIVIADEKEGAAKEAAGHGLAFQEMESRQGALLKLAKHDDVGVASFRTSRVLDQSNVQQLGEEFQDLTRKYNLKKVVLNFDNVQYLSSAVMGKLVGLHKELQSAGGELRLCNIGDSIYEIFRIMRFDKLFKICKSEDEAVIELIR